MFVLLLLVVAVVVIVGVGLGFGNEMSTGHEVVTPSGSIDICNISLDINDSVFSHTKMGVERGNMFD